MKPTYEDLEKKIVLLESEISDLNLQQRSSEQMQIIQLQNEELKKAKNLAELNERKYKMLFEATGTVNSIFDQNCCLIIQNSLSKKELGKGETSIGQSVFQIFGESLGKSIYDRMTRVLHTGISETFETQFDLSTGLKWFRSSYQPVPDQENENNIVAVQIISQDITGIKTFELELLKAQKEVEEREKKFQQLVWDMRVGVLIQGSKAEIVMSNPAALELLGLTEDQILGRTSFDPDWNVIHEDGSLFPGPTHPVPVSIATCKPVRNVVMGVYHPREKDYIWLLVDAIPQIVVDGVVQQVVCTFINITDRKKAEQSLRESEIQLRELNATKDKFFSIIAHDLKSPFNAIVGFSELLVDQIREKDYDGLIEYAGYIHSSSLRAMSLLSNLLEWSRTQIGRMNYSPERIELQAIVNETIELLTNSAKQKDIVITNKIPEKLIVFADKTMIGTVLRNLVSNAIKFTNTGGHVTLTAQQVDDNLLVSVLDNGVGIRKEAIPNLFLIEESKSTSGTEKEIGTGLGLMLCKEFIEKHGGRIWAESEVGVGSTFKFTLPRFG
jgi:two-component system sensor histidine kinase/response regulator